MKVIAQNKKAIFDYEILEELEAGVQLEGREVKSLRTQKPNLKGAFVSIAEGTPWLKNVHIPRYKCDGSGTYDPKRDRKLLLNKKEMVAITNKMNEKGTTVVPISLYFKNNLVKAKIALVRGKKKYDKRETIRKREQERQMKRAIKNYG
jgi:SsrA-binding protein